MLIDALVSARDLGRLVDIVGVLTRHGLGDLVQRMGWTEALEKAGHHMRLERTAELARLPRPVQLRMALEELGPTFVKLGQILAGRADLLGPEYIAELEHLHSRVPALPLEALREQLREDLGGEPEAVFAHFDPEPLAAASIAQVHRARLHDGTEVVVKVRRPGIGEVIDADLRLLERLAAIAEHRLPALAPYRPRGLVHEFGRSLRRELDLAAECRNAERIAGNLKPLNFVAIPPVVWDFTKERINVQHYVGGVPGQALDRLDAEGFDRQLLARRGAQAVMKMIVEDGFFHADPHPGNVFYLPGNRIAFIDFGMVGRLSQRRREELLQLLLGLVQRQPRQVADVLLDWAEAQGGGLAGAHLGQLEAEIEGFVDQYHGTPLAQLNLGQMLADTTAILREHHLALPSDLALLIKAFISLEGMGRALDPAFHMATEALPLLRQVVRARYQPRALALRGWSSLQRVLQMAEQLPHDISHLLRSARRGQLNVAIDVVHLQHVGDQLDRAASRLSVSLVIAALIIGSSIVMTVGGGPQLFGLPAFGLLGFVSATVGGIWLVRSTLRARRHD
ncbi:ubiquinone biosynthesis protein UbiB [Ideonella sp. 4Y11]|uniref:Ubiquinone biosynthesis protein UbiB n=1 Tax=Ideonella aquatica TaxID=2824119 RepID=A0A941BNW6_9BURK|nr:AarF/UbiB family protein [Ideonella aquatica]MBQ0957420.1 ubiquinone biosynthesis protein UbiB [Ideonella aquatica]